ncbi:unnamed protein product [Schistosoma margrebowiei]|uniref:Uncharacterized protein n=1 Tax=Schistosoma margrebowiei TaxID=48269 RepID=A0A183LID1_9TREM|nr:unnamed protein product [Schistosoma margrebowiei]
MLRVTKPQHYGPLRNNRLNGIHHSTSTSLTRKKHLLAWTEQHYGGFFFETTSWGKHGIPWTARMQLNDLDFADDLALLSHTQRQMQEKTTSVAAPSAAVSLNIHKGKSKFLRYNTACTNPIIIDGKALEDAENFTNLGSIIDGHGGSDADVKAQIGNSRTAYLQLKKIYNSKQLSVNCQHQGQNFQYKYQDSSTVWRGN